MNELRIKFQSLIEEKKWILLKEELNILEPHQIAETIEELSKADQILLFRLLSREQAKEVFQHLTHSDQEDMINGLAENSNKIADLLNDLDPDDRTAFLEELPGKVCQRLMQMMSKKERAITVQLLGYPEDSIGRLMTPEYVAVRPHYTVAQALEHIRIYGRDSETLNVIYIVDENWKLLDDLRIKELILASPNQQISELTDNRFTALNANDDQEVAIKMFRDYDRVALPVVNTNGILVGIVTVDDMMDVVEIENTENFHKFGSIQDAVVNPLKARITDLYKKRIVWLIALVFMNVFSGAAMASFENVIQSVVTLVFFLPLLIDSGGNAGSQSATLMIRALAVGDVEMHDWAKLLGKELFVSLLLGLTMALGVSLIASFRAPEVMVVVALTMVLNVIVGSMLGMLLPFIFTKLKADPAAASAPLITSIADISGVVIYFSIASWYFSL